MSLDDVRAMHELTPAPREDAMNEVEALADSFRAMDMGGRSEHARDIAAVSFLMTLRDRGYVLAPVAPAPREIERDICRVIMRRYVGNPLYRTDDDRSQWRWTPHLIEADLWPLSSLVERDLKHALALAGEGASIVEVEMIVREVPHG